MNWETFLVVFILFALAVIVYALFNSVKYYQKLYDESKIIDNRILRTVLCFLMAMLYALVALSGMDPLNGLED